MWPEITRHLGSYPSAVLTGYDASGYPFSVRCRPKVDPAARIIRVDVPAEAGLKPGPASLLCHSHNQLLWNLRSFLLRGVLERDADGWHFRVTQFVPGIGIGGVVGMMQFAVAKRRAAGKYLADRRLRRPRIPWDELRGVKAQAKRGD